VSGKLICINIPNFIKISQMICDILQFFFHFQDGGHPPSWICVPLMWTTCKEHLVVFIVVQNLVAIEEVISII